MKKVYIGILAMLYMAVSSGIAMELHYCMGQEAGMDLYGSASDKCGKCGMDDKESGCCHDDFKFYKLSDSHKTVSNDIDLAAPVFTVVNDHNLYDWQMPYNTALTAVNNHSPPQHYTLPKPCIMNCVFRL